MTGAALRAIEVSRVHGSGPSAVHGCRNVNLAVSAGELLAITGPSGAGKTTLLNLLGGLDRPTTGQVILDSADLAAMSERQLVYLRRNRIGYLFDSPGLIPILSAAENVEAPLRLLYVWPRERRARVAELLDLVGMGDRGDSSPAELSPQQQQRVALARALACEPDLLIADEPVSRLDPPAGRSIMELICLLVRQRAITAVVATAETEPPDWADRVLELRDGRLPYATTA